MESAPVVQIVEEEKRSRSGKKWRERQEKGGTGRKYEMRKRIKKRKNKLKYRK